jgi:sulfur relay (sulfurtransferase) complex TusBCD TusD component (DsrE family)
MSQYVLIASRDPFTSGTTAEWYELAREYRQQGHHVTLFLIENGVLAARVGAHCPSLARALADGVTVVADEFALRARAIPASALWRGITPVPLEQLADALASGHKVLWH